VTNFDDLLAVLKQILGICEVDSSEDAALTAYLNGAISACETYLDRVIISQRSVTERLVNIRAPRVLRYRPVGALQAVTYEGDDVLSDWELIKHTDYAELHNVNDWRFCVDYDEELVVTYQAGFTDCPYDLMLAISQAAASMRSMAGVGGTAPGMVVKKEMMNGIGSVEYDIDSQIAGTSSFGLLPPQTIQILDIYRGYYNA